jgi:hypothetical protein
MALKASYEFLFAGNDDNSFLENYYYDLFQEYGDKSGQIFVNLEIQNNPVDAEEIGAAIFETMQKVFYEDVAADPYERFEIALKAVNGVLGEFREQKTSGYIGNLNVVISAVVGKTLLLTQSGDAEAYLVRKRYVSIVSEGLSDETPEGDLFTNIASGEIEEGDFVLFSSTRLLRYISKTDLAKTIVRMSVEETLNDIKDVISTEMLGRIGLIGIMFDEATDAEEMAGVAEMSPETETKGTLKSSEGNISAEKESLTGKFLTAIRNRRSKKGEVYPRENRTWASVKDGVSNFFGGLFSGGFGKNKIFILLIVVIGVLTIGIWIAKSNLAAREEIKKLDVVLSSVQEKLVEAETKGEYDKKQAKEILDAAYEDAIKVLNSGYYREKAILNLNQIDEMRDNLDNVVRLETPKVLADLTTKRSDVNALGFAEVGDRVFVYEYNALYEIVLDQVQDPLTIDDDEMVIDATGFDDRGSVVFLTKSGNLIEYKDGTMSFMDSDDGSFHKGVAIEDWSNKIYLLDSTNSAVWKYTYKGTRDKFGTAEEYFVDDDVDVTGGQDITIDGSIYVLDNTGDVFKFYAGEKADFWINNSPYNAFKDPSVIYTNEKLDDVYILDSQDGRVLVFEKDTKTGNLNYTSQYLIDTSGELRDMYVDADSKKLYVLTPTSILEIDL